MSRIVKSLGSSMRKIPSILPTGLVCAVLACLVLAAAWPEARAEQVKTIHPTGYVTDLAGVLDASTRARLEALSAELEQKAGAQMAIVTVHSLEGEAAPQFANELFKQLGVGSKKEDRGVLMLVAPDEHKYWTEVGYGLEPVINDARTGDAGRAMVPLLRQGNYSAAIETAAWQLAKYIADDRGVSLSGEPPVRQVRTTDDRSGGSVGVAIAFLVGFLILASIISRFSGRGGGGGGSGIGWLIASILLSGGGGGRSGGGSWGGGGFGGGSGGGGFGGFGGGSSGGGGAGGSW
jgi:uncharacterized protein